MTSIVQYAIAQAYTPEARVLIARMYQTKQLYIPEIFLLECVNLLCKEVRFRGLPQTQAEQIAHKLAASLIISGQHSIFSCLTILN